MKRIVGIPCALLLCFLICPPYSAWAAEVLGVRSFNLLQIGDQNRTYTVRLACVEIEPSYEELAKNWLKSELPRRRKVNLRPQGSIDGVLLARVTPIGSDIDLAEGLVAAGLGDFVCSPASS